MKKILIVCLGNICRSPTAEAVLRTKSVNQGINLQVDSAGTINYHQGNKPDTRAIAAGEKRGYSFSGISSRGVIAEDFSEFDYILAADQENKQDLLKRCPAQYQYKIDLFLAFAGLGEQVIPDPYYGGDQGFELVLDLLEKASENILVKIGSD
ncbi:low molecular weight phosphotyrosine protein phosphatase [Psychromonas sp. 14N.309.X.WAT.B.A12]|uniref:low molecular weight protein-tyrosine-phosphatase n=1 Tax=Psychromonas sp. 14N.309.X.WAT.B.A12 TaxID=2998322 RepID=UPI0025B06CC2|nr:low molecular weight protein-tyrosine-phosphatase [Psychromonas sp. 14N.309.X.WAT.B.A12]MDN2662033.1 low molecular weight phosphotyrosine protein phosphatase [Psychromonas sp. 14N.309.X.WAT.B.A12]